MRYRALAGTSCTVLLALAGCGGGSGSSDKTTTSTASTTPSTATAPTTATATTPAAPTTLEQQIRLLVPGQAPAAPASSVKAKNGDRLLLMTTLPGGRQGPPEQLSVTIDRAAGKMVKVTARSGGQTSSATVRAAGSSAITLSSPRWTCALPPDPTFCPARSTTTSSKSYRLSFLASPGAPVSIQALVTGSAGGADAKLKPRPKATAKAAPFTIDAGLVARSPTAKPSTKPPTFVKEAKVHVGDVISMRALVKGLPTASAQQVTVSLAHGPAHKLTLRVQAKGGKASTVVVRSASDAAISLVQPGYSCQAPPSPSVCPADHVSAGAKSYTLLFSVRAPIAIVVNARVAGA